MKFAQWVFSIAGIWGIVVLTPLYFRFDALGRATPPPITHPEFYYGFLAVALVWQLAFLLIATDPVRFRPLMIVAILEKFTYVASIGMLYARGRVGAGDFTLGAAADFVLGSLFVAAFLATPPRAARR
jgi:hypothetical protein